jgi:hypothetical protein
VLLEVLVRAEDVAHAEAVGPGHHQRPSPGSSLAEHIRVPQHQAERFPARLVEAQEQPAARRQYFSMPLVKKSGIAPCNGYVFGAKFCLPAFHGRPMLPFLTMGKPNWLCVNPIPGRHSEEPADFYSLVEAMSLGPRLDCFARKTRPGWDVWGDKDS